MEAAVANFVRFWMKGSQKVSLPTLMTLGHAALEGRLPEGRIRRQPRCMTIRATYELVGRRLQWLNRGHRGRRQAAVCCQLLAAGSSQHSQPAVLWSTQLWSLFAASQQLLAQNSWSCDEKLFVANRTTERTKAPAIVQTIVLPSI